MSFKDEFVSQCRSALCESGPFDMEIEEQKVNKAQRGVLNGVLFTKEGLECAPTFYIEDFYKAYKEGTSIKDLSHNAIEAAVQCMDMAGVLAKDTFDMLGDTDYLVINNEIIGADTIDKREYSIVMDTGYYSVFIKENTALS